MGNFWDGWFSPQEQTAIANGLPPGQQFVLAGPKGEKYAAVSTGSGLQVSQQPIVAGAPNAPKVAVSKYSNGSVHVVSVDNGDVTDQTISGADPALAAKEDAQTKLDLAKAGQIGSPEAIAKEQAQTRQYNARADQIAAMAAVNPALAQARADRLNEQIANDAALTPAKIQQYQATAAQRLSAVGLNVAKAGQANSTAGKLDAEANKLTQGFLATYGPQIAVIHKAVNDGSMTADQGQQAIDGLTQQAIQEARTGLTAAQRTTNDTALRNQDVTQANNRASNAASVFNSAGNTAMDAAKNGAGGPAAAGGFLAMLHAAPPFQADMGGGLVTDDHKQRIAQLVQSGQAPADANGDRFPAAVRMVAQEAGVTVPGAGGSEPGPPDQPPSGQGFLGGLGSDASGSPIYQGGAFK